MRSIIWLVVILFVGEVGLLAAPRRPWIYAESENFEMLSSTSVKESQNLLADFEEFHGLLQIFFGGPRLAKKRTTIVVFEFDEDFVPYKPRDGAGNPANMAAYYLENKDAAYIAMVSGPATERDVREVVYHEYVHQFFRMMDYDLPPWLNEGLAEVLSTLRVKKKKLEFGYYKETYLHYLTQYGINISPMAWLFSVERGSSSYQHGYLQAKFYAQSWLLVHYWMSHPAMFEGYLRYLDLWEKTDYSDLKAMELAFGMDDEQMQDALERYLKEGKYSVQSIPLESRPKRIRAKFRRATPFEIDLGLENLRVRALHPVDGEVSFMALSDRYPESPQPYETLAILAGNGGEFETAKQYFAEAISRGTQNSHVHVGYVSLELDRIDVESSLDYRLPDASTEAYRQSLNLALESNPHDTEGVEYLAYLESIARKPRIANIKKVESMVKQLRDSRETLLSLAVIRWRFNDIPTCESILEVLRQKKPLRGHAKRRLELLESRLLN